MSNSCPEPAFHSRGPNPQANPKVNLPKSAKYTFGTMDLLQKEAARVFPLLVRTTMETKVSLAILGIQAGLSGLIVKFCAP